MRRTRSHLFETLYILGMITLIASVLIGAISWLGRNTLYFIGTTAESPVRVACSGFEDQPPPTTTSLGWQWVFRPARQPMARAFYHRK